MNGRFVHLRVPVFHSSLSYFPLFFFGFLRQMIGEGRFVVFLIFARAAVFD